MLKTFKQFFGESTLVKDHVKPLADSENFVSPGQPAWNGLQKLTNR
jgi:hypothetical protein